MTNATVLINGYQLSEPQIQILQVCLDNYFDLLLTEAVDKDRVSSTNVKPYLEDLRVIMDLMTNHS